MDEASGEVVGSWNRLWLFGLAEGCEYVWLMIRGWECDLRSGVLEKKELSSELSTIVAMLWADRVLGEEQRLAKTDETALEFLRFLS